jgi:CO/xanthine dehydrogenase Mo-binding subunit
VRSADRRPRSLGRRLARVDGAAKAKGEAIYPQDVALPEGCLHLAAVRAPVARARIRAIDTKPALAVAGVVRVLTAKDVKGTNRFGLIEPDQPVLATDVVRGASDVVALVVAESERAAREGARRVALDIVAEPALTDPEHACDAGAPVVDSARAARRTKHPNLLAAREIRRGDAAKALACAAVTVGGEYRTDFVEHAFLAPEAGMAMPHADGGLTLFVATQWPEEDLRQAAVALGERADKLRLVQQTIGGSFGGREDISLQILLLLAARSTGRPVRMVWDRRESVRGHGKRHPFRIRHRLAADAKGRFIGVEIDVLVDAGCYASTSAPVLDNALSQACGPYAIANALVRGRAVLTNNPYTCAFRGFGVNQMTFAMEQQVNKLAAALGLDPATVRRRNFVAPGGTLATGGKVSGCGTMPKALGAAARRAARHKLPAARGDWRYGRGLASALKNVGYGFGSDDRATAQVTVTRQGALVRIGAAEVGQGVETVLTQIAADTLGLAPAKVHVLWQDTSRAPEAGSSSASRQSFISGNAVRGACALARRALDRPDARSVQASDGITRSFTYRAPRTSALGARAGASHACAYTWSSCVADVRVDVATGRVEVLRVVSALDVGRALNPLLLEGQVEGGVVMAQGYALQERCVTSEGMPVSLGFDACNIPTAMDAAPAIECVCLESPEPAGPFGARGAGEITMIPVVPALTAAIHDAVGVWLDSIPAPAERVLSALAMQREASAERAPRRRHRRL